MDDYPSLTNEEAAKRLAEYGENYIADPSDSKFWKLLHMLLRIVAKV